MRNALLKTLGISAAAATIALFAYGASAQDAKKKEPAAKKPAACTTLKDEAGCTGRDDCTWTPAKGKAKAACKAKPKAKAPAKKEPAKK